MTRTKSEQRTWSRHYQDAWHERSGNPNLPRWLRVVALAYGSHDEAGHARFRRGEVALVLAGPFGRDEVPQPLSRQRVHEAIQQAIQLGFLADGSIPMCLIVPAHDVRKGAMEGRPKRCPVHERRKR